MEKNVILFVDDEPHVTAALSRVFRTERYEVLDAGSAQQALEILADRHVDVVVSDEQMPGMSGSQLLAVVRETHPRTIRILLTGQASIEAAMRAINEGEVYRFFTKPCNEMDLKVSIRQALQQRDLASGSRWLLQQYQRQTSVLEELESRDPGITHVEMDAAGAYVIDAADDDVDALLQKIASTRRET